MNNNWKKMTYAVHPGEILQEYLEDEGISQVELSKRTSLNKTVINEIIKGKRSITMRTAIKLERVFSFDAKFWCNLQLIYDEIVERLKLSEEELSCKAITASSNIDCDEMVGTSYVFGEKIRIKQVNVPVAA